MKKERIKLVDKKKKIKTHREKRRKGEEEEAWGEMEKMREKGNFHQEQARASLDFWTCANIATFQFENITLKILLN